MRSVEELESLLTSKITVNPDDGRALPYGVDTPEGKGTVTEADVRMGVHYDLVIQRGREQREKDISEIMKANTPYTVVTPLES